MEIALELLPLMPMSDESRFSTASIRDCAGPGTVHVLEDDENDHRGGYDVACRDFLHAAYTCVVHWCFGTLIKGSPHNITHAPSTHFSYLLNSTTHRPYSQPNIIPVTEHHHIGRPVTEIFITMTTIFDVPGTNPPNPFSPLIQQAFHDSSHESARFSELSAQTVEQVTSSPNPATAFWSLWDAFFAAIATSTSPPTSRSDPFISELALLDALRAHPPTTPNNVAAGSDAELRLRTTYLNKTDGKIHWSQLPGFDAQWRDVHDILEARRDWDGIRPRKQPEGTTDTPTESDRSERHEPARYFLRFVDFSVALLWLRWQRQRNEDGGGGSSGAPLSMSMWVFFNCKNVLERAGGPQLSEHKGHRLSPEQVWALDLRVMATWVQGGAGVLWEADQEALRENYTAALDQGTDLWPRGEGLTRERWMLWGRRLRELLGGEERDGGLDEETRTVVKEAAEVIEGLLQGE
jgi:hypothetical protein